MNTVRKIGVMLLMTFIAMCASAKIAFGVRAGIGESALIQKIDLEYRSGERLGFSVAGLMDIPLYKRFSLRPELGFTHQGGDYLSNLSTDDLPVGFTVQNKSSFYTIQLPINLAWTFKISDVDLSVHTGPVLDYRLFGEFKSKDILTGAYYGNEKPKPFDLGVDIGLSVEYVNVFFSINALSGTLDRRLDKQNVGSRVFQNNVTFSLGYFFR